MVVEPFKFVVLLKVAPPLNTEPPCTVKLFILAVSAVNDVAER